VTSHKPQHASSGETGFDETAGWIVARAGASGFRTELEMGGFALIADEPATAGGSGAGPTPYEFLLAALASCTAMTVRMYASRKQWPLEGVTIRLRNTPAHIKDCLDCETEPVGPRRLDRVVHLEGPLTDEQHARLLQIADRCPVKQTLERGIQIRTVE
jgi:putative redox protein